MRAPFLLLIALLMPAFAGAQERIPSACLAISQNEARVIPAAFGAPLDDNVVRIRFLGHASFALETAGGLLAITDYTGFIGNPDVIPDVVTMNNAHDTHFTDFPDPRIAHVLRGWGPPLKPARIELDLGEMLVRNVTTDLRGPFGEGARANGNSIFIFEVAGLCIGHLSHLHQIPSAAQYAAIGRLDVVMVPVDGGYTMTTEAMAEVVRHFRARLVLPMHWFSEATLARFLADLNSDFEIDLSEGSEVEVSLPTLPRRPKLLVLAPALLP